jgi:hypothetical protein
MTQDKETIIVLIKSIKSTLEAVEILLNKNPSWGEISIENADKTFVSQDSFAD